MIRCRHIYSISKYDIITSLYTNNITTKNPHICRQQKTLRQSYVISENNYMYIQLKLICGCEGMYIFDNLSVCIYLSVQFKVDVKKRVVLYINGEYVLYSS